MAEYYESDEQFDPVLGWLVRSKAVRVLDRGSSWDIEQAWVDRDNRVIWRKIPVVREYEQAEKKSAT